MAANRLFVSQAKLDTWLSEGQVEVTGDVMTTKPEARRFNLKTAVLFREEVTGTAHPELLGKVKDLDQIAALGGEYAAGSVIVGDCAYNTVEGFVGDPILDRPKHGDTLAAAMRTATGEHSAQPSELDLLARFFLQTRQ